MVTQQEFNAYALPDNLFYEQVLERKLNHTMADTFESDKSLSDFPELTENALCSRHNGSGRYSASYVLLEEGPDSLVLISFGTNVGLTVASTSSEVCKALVEKYRNLIPVIETPPDDQTNIFFWMASGQGPKCVRRRIDVPTWDDIEGNYVKPIQEPLDKLMTAESGRDMQDGQLILWQGEPGTGKTYALRALARSWRSWCDFHYITDPEQFFGSSEYMMNVILTDNSTSDWDEEGNQTEDKWKLLILEDSGELLSADAKQNVGQALSRLLNVVDGMIGQGLKLMILVTTNEQLKKLHPAVSRYGRCASKLEFDAMPVEKCKEWAEQHDVSPATITSPMSLSELFALKNGAAGDINEKAFGFAAN